MTGHSERQIAASDRLERQMVLLVRSFGKTDGVVSFGVTDGVVSFGVTDGVVSLEMTDDVVDGQELPQNQLETVLASHALDSR